MTYASDKTNSLSTLLEMLTYKRPAYSATEKAFVARYLPDMESDGFGNLWHVVGKDSRVLWSSHTDSVHMSEGRQLVTVKDGLISSKGAQCLGADCATGVWLMLEMIAAKVPGTYVFHRCEEIGGLGSQFIADNHSEVLANFDYAIAFDRRAFTSIITHQGGRRGCSPAFVKSLAPMLPGAYRADSTGSFTDTANYFDHVAECTNISVGYEGEHSARETQDVAHAMALRDKLIAFDESKLVAARTPEPDSYLATVKEFSRTMVWDDADYFDLVDLIKSRPHEVADWFEQQGYDVQTLRDELNL